ncbi:hypothetical protein ACR80R_04700 [Aquipuribacter sp. MA13-13]
MAGASAVVYVLVIAIPTDLIDTGWFWREIPPPVWTWPALLLSSVLAGLLTATYVADPRAQAGSTTAGTAPAGPSRGGWVGGALTFFAVGCPVCNKLVLLALGTAGAMSWFEPVQPVLQVVAIAVLAWALNRRLVGERSCALVPA